MKPRLFIGSSVEGMRIAGALQKGLNYETRPTVWSQAFPLSSVNIDALIENCTVNDFAVFVFSADDVAAIRRKEYEIARDNVVFEAGLFMGMHGRGRAFIVIPQDAPKLHLPSDLLGLTTASYDAEWAKKDPFAAVGSAVAEILETIRRADWKAGVELNMRAAHEPVAKYVLKLYLTFRNVSDDPVVICDARFEFAPGIPVARDAPSYIAARRIYFGVGKDDSGKDVNKPACVIESLQTVQAWIPLDPKYGIDALESAVKDHTLGSVSYRVVRLGNPPTAQRVEAQL